MAEFHFLRGTFKGRLGDVVFSSWKGIDYAKTYTKPANPRTAGQTGHRAVFSRLAHLGKGLNEAVLKPFTFPVPQKKIPYNVFMESNIELLQANLWNISKLQIFSGPLPLNPIKTATWNSSTKTLKIEWDQGNHPAEDADDTAIGVIVQDDVVIGVDSNSDRGDQSITWNNNELPEMHNGQVHIFLTFSRPPTPNTNEQGMVSRTAYATTTITGLPRSLPDESATPDKPAKTPPEKQEAKG